MNKYKITLFLIDEDKPTSTTIEESDHVQYAVAKAISKIEDKEILYKYISSFSAIAIVNIINSKSKCPEIYTISGTKTHLTTQNEALISNPKIAKSLGIED